MSWCNRERTKFFRTIRRHHFACHIRKHTFNAWCVWQLSSASYMHGKGNYLVSLLFLLLWALCTHTQLNPFLSFFLFWHHVCEIMYQALPAFPFSKQGKVGWGLGMRLYLHYKLVIEMNSLQCSVECVEKLHQYQVWYTDHYSKWMYGYVQWSVYTMWWVKDIYIHAIVFIRCTISCIT